MPSCAIIYAVFPGCFKIRKAGVLAVLHKVTFTLFYPLFVLCLVGRRCTSQRLEFRAFHTGGNACRLFRAYLLSSNFIEPFCLCAPLSITESGRLDIIKLAFAIVQRLIWSFRLK